VRALPLASRSDSAAIDTARADLKAALKRAANRS
jgi:hypothetical protein